MVRFADAAEMERELFGAAVAVALAARGHADVDLLAQDTGYTPARVHDALGDLVREGIAAPHEGGFRATDVGRARAWQLVEADRFADRDGRFRK